MQLKEERHLLLSETHVPDVFIAEYMQGLSADAVRCYLYILMAVKNQMTLNEKDLAGRLHGSLEEVKVCLTELAAANVIDWTNKGAIVIRDLKEIEVRNFIKLKKDETASHPADMIPPENERRDKLGRSIEKTFFHGSMSYKWYAQLDVLLDEYGFEEDVVYKLFQICRQRQKLGTSAYLMAIANNWHAKNIRTLDELSMHLDDEEKLSRVCRALSRKLRVKLNAYDEAYIRNWIEKMRFSDELIDYAVKIANEYGQHGAALLKRADEHLKLWFGSGITTREEALAYEEKRAQDNKKQYQMRKAAEQKPRDKKAKQNFSAPQYDEAYLDSLVTDPEELTQSILSANDSKEST